MPSSPSTGQRLFATVLGSALTLSGWSVRADDIENQADPAKPIAFIEVPENDPSFDLLGEFVGEIKATDDGQPLVIGLQLRPVNSIDFDAMVYRGGLPGAGYLPPDPAEPEIVVIPNKDAVKEVTDDAVPVGSQARKAPRDQSESSPKVIKPDSGEETLDSQRKKIQVKLPEPSLDLANSNETADVESDDSDPMGATMAPRDSASEGSASVFDEVVRMLDDGSLRLIGRRSGDRLVLSGGPVAFFVDPQGCTMVDHEGNRLGRLDRIFRVSPTLGARPPEGAIVLFDGEPTNHLDHPNLTEEGWVCEGFAIKPMIQDFDLHLEFRIPYMPSAEGQKRGNSGIYIHGRYECQILDSFATAPASKGLGAIYRTKGPDLNMALPPLRWQTYDIRFTSARFNSDGSKFSPATVTAWVNGIKVQDNIEMEAPTGRGKPEEPNQRPIHIQDHGDPVRFRNLWMIDRGRMRTEFPVPSVEQETLQPGEQAVGQE